MRGRVLAIAVGVLAAGASGCAALDDWDCCHCCEYTREPVPSAGRESQSPEVPATAKPATGAYGGTE